MTLKFSWRVMYWGRYGTESALVSAENRIAAVKACPVSSARVIRVDRQWFGWRQLQSLLQRPNEKAQLNVLLNAQAHCLTGNFDKMAIVLRKTAAIHSFIKPDSGVMREDLEISQRLRLLQFDPEVCAAVENGEQVGDLSSGISAAIQYLKRLMELRAKTSHQLVFGLTMFIASLVVFFFFLPILGDALRPLLEIKDINFSATVATNILLAVSGFIATYGIGLALVIMIICLTIIFYYPKIKNFFPLSLFNDLDKSRRSIKFLAAWSLYRGNGMVVESDRQSLCRILGNEVGDEIYRLLERGESLAEAINTRYFSPILVGAMPALCCFQASELKSVSNLLLENLVEEQGQKSKMIAGLFHAFAVVISLTLVFILAYGLIFPMLSMVSGFQL